jgi:hypothetical protein
MLEKALSGVDAQDLRDLSSARAELKSSVQEIIGKFNW